MWENHDKDTMINQFDQQVQTIQNKIEIFNRNIFNVDTSRCLNVVVTHTKKRDVCVLDKPKDLWTH